MTVDSAQFDGLAVQEEVASLDAEFILGSRGILDAYFAESDYGRENVEGLSGSVLQHAYEGIAVRSLSGPGLGVGEFERGRSRPSVEVRHQEVRVRIEQILVQLI